ncbi:MAG TPA: ABC transporter ATP-binding protein [Candidatus Eremiobacteraceae bacterium]|nr:ABC transporter ATP-binding protein [Candidatus Eremiobacteraceae bacterium]
MIAGAGDAGTIDIRSLTKRYGSVLAVDDVSFNVPEGSIFGLLGTNGAGKTTTFKCMLGLARANSGTVTFGGRPLEPAKFQHIAYVPERCALYDWMNGTQHLEFYRRSYRNYDDARARQLTDLFHLDLRKRVKALSKGQQTALALVLAFSIRPQILVLDEPTSGLDPVHQRHVLDLMISESSAGTTILFSSHQIGQVERAAERIAILHNSKLVLQGEVEELRSDEKIIEATFDSDMPSLNGIESDPRVRLVTRNGRLVRAFVRRDTDGLMKLFADKQPRSLRILDQNLEDIFLSAVGDDVNAAKSWVE